MSRDNIISLKNIPVKFIERKWMRSLKSWRCTVELPQEEKYEILSPALSGMIDGQFKIDIAGEFSININPMSIIDVPVKGKKAQLVLETVYEHQNIVGPKLTCLVDQDIMLTISPTGIVAPEKKTIISGDITEKSLRGLHVFFQNKKFQEFIDKLTGRKVSDKDTCKSIFKEHMKVESCKELDEQDTVSIINGFNDWLNGGSY